MDLKASLAMNYTVLPVSFELVNFDKDFNSFPQKYQINLQNFALFGSQILLVLKYHIYPLSSLGVTNCI